MSPFESIVPQPGLCDVCGQSRILTVLDRGSSLRVGDCCYGALAFTHFLLSNLSYCGMRHPEPNEFREQDNH